MSDNYKVWTDKGVLSGFVALPDGGERKINMYGTVRELLEVVRRIGLFADEQQVEQIEDGDQVTVLYFTDNKGSHATMQPVSQASEYLARTYRVPPL